MERSGKLLGWMREHEKTQADLADLLGVTIGTISKKVNGKVEFTLSECRKICEEWQLSMEIFDD